MSVVRLNHFRAKEGHADALLALVKETSKRISKAPGCLLCEVLVEDEDTCRIVVYDVFENAEQFKNALLQFSRIHFRLFDLHLACAPSGAFYHQVAARTPSRLMTYNPDYLFPRF